MTQPPPPNDALPPTRSATVGASSIPTALPVAATVRARRGVVRTVARHFWGLAGWKKALLIVAILLGSVGAVGSVGGFVRDKPVEMREAQVTVESLDTTARRSSLTGEQKVQLEQAKVKVDELRHWFYDKTAPQLWRIGLGFAVAFVLGYIARQFVKTMTALLAIVLVGVVVAGYFGFVDATKIRADVTTGTGWVMDRLDGFKDQLLALIGASVSGTIGFVIGFMRGPR